MDGAGRDRCGLRPPVRRWRFRRRDWGRDCRCGSRKRRGGRRSGRGRRGVLDPELPPFRRRRPGRVRLPAGGGPPVRGRWRRPIRRRVVHPAVGIHSKTPCECLGACVVDAALPGEAPTLPRSGHLRRGMTRASQGCIRLGLLQCLRWDAMGLVVDAGLHASERVPLGATMGQWRTIRTRTVLASVTRTPLITRVAVTARASRTAESRGGTTSSTSMRMPSRYLLTLPLTRVAAGV